MYYQEITLLKNNDITIYKLWSRVYTKLHIGMVNVSENGQCPIGVTFPEYSQRFMGTKIRLFSVDKDTLKKFNASDNLDDLLDYVHVTSIKEVPDYEYSVAWIRQPRSKSKISVAKRKSKRHDMTIDEALDSLGDYVDNYNNDPFIIINSFSSNMEFPMKVGFIVDSEHVNSSFTFNTYGLSTVKSYNVLPYF